MLLAAADCLVLLLVLGLQVRYLTTRNLVIQALAALVEIILMLKVFGHLLQEIMLMLKAISHTLVDHNLTQKDMKPVHGEIQLTLKDIIRLLLHKRLTLKDIILTQEANTNMFKESII